MNSPALSSQPPARPARRTKTGLIVGPYRVDKLIAVGTTARVYRGVHERLGYPVAIKFLHDFLFENRTVFSRFVDEAQTAARTRSPGMVDVLDHGFDDEGSAYIVMELIEGATLDEHIRQRGPLDHHELVDIGVQLATALATLHGAGIVHRDLKPANIGLAPDSTRPSGFTVKVLDLGLAKHLTAADSMDRTKTGCVLGTPMYMAPEQCRGARGADHLSDIYAIGCVLFHAATGRPPFSGSPLTVTESHKHKLPPTAGSLRPDLSPDIDHLISAMLSKPRDGRPQSMTEVAHALRAARAGTAAPMTELVPRLTTAPASVDWDAQPTLVDDPPMRQPTVPWAAVSHAQLFVAGDCGTVDIRPPGLSRRLRRNLVTIGVATWCAGALMWAIAFFA